MRGWEGQIVGIRQSQSKLATTIRICPNNFVGEVKVEGVATEVRWGYSFQKRKRCRRMLHLCANSQSRPVCDRSAIRSTRNYGCLAEAQSRGYFSVSVSQREDEIVCVGECSLIARGLVDYLFSSKSSQLQNLAAVAAVAAFNSLHKLISIFRANDRSCIGKCQSWHPMLSQSCRRYTKFDQSRAQIKISGSAGSSFINY